MAQYEAYALVRAPQDRGFPSRSRGHSGDDGSGESHFTVVIESAAFSGKSRLERQRMVNAALGDIPGTRVHALAIKTLAPEEVA